MSKWPKSVTPLTPEQHWISDNFMLRWHEKLPKYRMLERFNHMYVVNHRPDVFVATLEVGAGNGEHLRYEALSELRMINYFSVDVRRVMTDVGWRRYPLVNWMVADCQERTNFRDGMFDRIIAIHVLEHLPNLPAAVSEMHRVCKPTGMLSVVIPCEGGWLYSLARRVSSQRMFEKMYNQPYDWFIRREHLNQPWEVFEELKRCFRIVDTTYFPFRVPSVNLNLCIGITLVPL